MQSKLISAPATPEEECLC